MRARHCTRIRSSIALPQRAFRQRTKVLGGLLACIRTNGRLVTKEASFNFIPQINVPDLRRIPWG